MASPAGPPSTESFATMDHPLMPLVGSVFALTAATLLFILQGVSLLQGSNHPRDLPGPWSTTPFGLLTIGILAVAALAVMVYFGSRLWAVDYPRRRFGASPNPPRATFREAARFLRAIRRDDRTSIVNHLSRIRGVAGPGPGSETVKSPSTGWATVGAYALILAVLGAFVAAMVAPGWLYALGGVPWGLLILAPLVVCYVCLLFIPYRAWFAWYARVHVVRPTQRGQGDVA